MTEHTCAEFSQPEQRDLPVRRLCRVCYLAMTSAEALDHLLQILQRSLPAHIGV